ncbi:Tat proofreading chaperone DmsD [Siccibacter colletis]|uniref:Tat proofreading chaperone DmsD n=1 Tax=Siccibacter colletis TaxID=1505757 RepID=UPI003CE81CF8
MSMPLTDTLLTPRMDGLSLSGRILGALFSQPPDSPTLAPVLALLEDEAFAAAWPVTHSQLDDIVQRLRLGLRSGDEPLPAAWQRLFIGPWALPAPPWGSVWLDRENVLFGDSMLALRQWMTASGIDYNHSEREPCDHIGTLLMLAAWLAEAGREYDVDCLLAWHLLPWSGRFLEVFIAEARHPFYVALGELTRLTLAAWRSDLPIPVVQKTLWR